MKLYHFIAIIALSLVISACTTGKINYKVNDQGQLVVQKTEEGEVAIRGNASDASSEAVEYEKNTILRAIYDEYLKLIQKGDFEGAKKIRIEIEVMKGKISSTPDTPVLVPVPSPRPETKKADPYEDPYAKMRRAAERK